MESTNETAQCKQNKTNPSVNLETSLRSNQWCLQLVPLYGSFIYQHGIKPREMGKVGKDLDFSQLSESDIECQKYVVF